MMLVQLLFLPIVWILAGLSLLVATFVAALFYARYCLERPERDRRIPVVVYAIVLLICACVAF